MESLHEKIVDRLANAFNHPHAKSNDEDKLNQLFNNTACTIIEDLQEILGILPSSSSQDQAFGSSQGSSNGLPTKWLLITIWIEAGKANTEIKGIFTTHALANQAMQKSFDHYTDKHEQTISEKDDCDASNFYCVDEDSNVMEWQILELK